MTRIILCVAIAGLMGALTLPVAASDNESQPATDDKEIRLPEKSKLFGSWRGKLGEQEIMLCISDKHATYYTVGHYSRVSMDLKGADALRWQETFPAGNTGTWKIDADSDEALRGQWENGRERRPITLARMPSAKGDTRFCETIYRELARTAPVKQLETQELNGLRFRKISAINGYVSSVEILDNSGKYAELNRYLQTGFTDKVVSAFACQDMNLFETDQNEEFPFVRRSSVFTVNGPWITLLDEGGGHCGAEPADNLPHLSTLGVATAKPLKLNRWLKSNPDQGAPDEDGQLYSPPDDLTSTIYDYTAHLRQSSRFKNDECDILDSVDPLEPTFEISLGDAGVIFSTSYVPVTADTCDVYGVEIPFAKLAPFLTPEGKRAVDRLKMSRHGTTSQGGILAPHRAP